MRGKGRLLLGLLLVAVALVLFLSTFGSEPEAVLAAVNARWEELRSAVREHPLLTSLFVFLAYVTFTSLCLPGALFLTVLGGALFGTLWATCLVSFASTLGATCALLLSRYLLRDWVTVRYYHRWQTVHREIEQGGSFYLLAVRLNPLIPYFLINLFFGLTRLPVWRFWIISQIGMLPATVLYTYAGAELGQVKSLQGLVSREVILALALLSVFPVVARVVAKRLLRKPA